MIERIKSLGEMETKQKCVVHTVDFQNSLTGQSHEDKIQLCKALFNKKI